MQQTRKLTPAEKWETATIANNFIFYKVMRNNPEICRELLEILLDMKIERIEMSQEEEISVDYGIKSIRADILAKNSEQVFNVEMQASDTKELPERARYYQGIIDVDTLKSGQRYTELKDSYVIFICLDDIFGKKLPVYTFENICLEDKNIRLNDRAYKYFFISENRDKLLNEKQKAFLRLVMDNRAETDFTGKILKLVENAKHNTQWRLQYMNWERQRTYDFDDGKEEGIRIAKVESAVTLIRKYHVEPKNAAADMGAPLDKVLEALRTSDADSDTASSCGSSI